jgi:hypothetical protein
MSFLDKVPSYISDLKKEIDQLRRDQGNIDWGHTCNCEFCDEEGVDADPDAEETSEKLDEAIADREVMIRRLKRHQELFNKPKGVKT